MDIEKINRIAQGSMQYSKTHPAREQGWIWHHCRRTAQIALKLVDHLDGNIERDVLYTGALFHDVGHGNEHHNEIGARIARELLSEIFPSGELDRICEIILRHNARKRPNEYSLELKIVQDADLLDHIGPINPWLTFHWSAIHQLTIDDTLEYLHGEHLRELTRWRDKLNLAPSISFFDQRIEFESKFYDEFERVHREGL